MVSCHGASWGAQHGHVWLLADRICFGRSAVESFIDRRDVMVELVHVTALDHRGQGKLWLVQADAKVELGGLRLRDQFAREICHCIAAMGLAPPQLLREGEVM